jgi:isopenicillin N synthase-like dioxygenase
VNTDAKFKCPDACAEQTDAFFVWLERTATAALREMLEHVCALSKSKFSWDKWMFAPESTLRILHYDRASTDEAPLELLEKTFPGHTDSSFVTIAPKSTMAALES